MPKAPNSPIRMYFLIQATECNGSLMSESECKACGLRMKGNHASNMERHVRRSHPGIYEKYLELKQKAFNPINKNYDPINSQLFEHFDINYDPAEFIKKKFKSDSKDKRKSVNRSILKREEIIEACVEIVTTNGRPFSIMNDSGFRTLLEPVLSTIYPPLIIDESNVKKFVTEKAARLRSLISETLKEKMINLKLDCITYCNRSFLSIHAQGLVDNKLQMFTLAVVEINVRNCTSDLSSIICSELNEFGISKNQIYSVTIDSGSNFIKVFENEYVDVSQTPSSSKDNKFGNIIIPDDSDDSPASNEPVDPEVQVITIYNEFEDDDNDLDSNTTEIILSKLHLEVSQENVVIENDFGVAEIKCIASTLQLAVNDTLKSCPELNETVKEARNFVKKLNTFSNFAVLKNLGVHVPNLDHSSRWRSTYDVIKKLLQMKNDCVKLSIANEDSKMWTSFENWCDCMKYCKHVTDTLHTEQLTLCDVYKLWYNCILETSKIGSTCQKTLFEKIVNDQNLVNFNYGPTCNLTWKNYLRPVLCRVTTT